MITNDKKNRYFKKILLASLWPVKIYQDQKTNYWLRIKMNKEGNSIIVDGNGSINLLNYKFIIQDSTKYQVLLLLGVGFN